MLLWQPVNPQLFRALCTTQKHTAHCLNPQLSRRVVHLFLHLFSPHLVHVFAFLDTSCQLPSQLVGQLDGVEEEHTEEEDEDEEEESAAGANGVAAAASDGDGGVVSNDSDTTTNSSVATTTTAVGGGRAAPPCAADVSAAAIAAAAVAGSNGCSGGCDSDGGSSNRSDGSTVPVRSMPVPMPMRKVIRGLGFKRCVLCVVWVLVIVFVSVCVCLLTRHSRVLCVHACSRTPEQGVCACLMQK